MIQIVMAVLLLMAVRGVFLLIKGEVTGKDYVIRGTVARLIGLCWVSPLILYFVLVVLEVAVLGPSSDAGETTARLVISAIIAIVIGTASAELLKRFSGGKAKTAKTQSGDGASWTNHVADSGSQSVDRLDGAPASDDQAATKTVEQAIVAETGIPAVEPLIAALGDPNPDVRASAAAALVQISAPGFEPLIAALKDRNKDVRPVAAETLVGIGAAAVEPLIVALQQYPEKRSVVAQILGKIRGPRAVEPLIAALKDQNEHVRQWAAHALGKIGDPRAVEPLNVALGDQNEDVRKWAAYALGEIGDPRAVEPLSAVFKDDSENQNVRKIAAQALGKIGTPAEDVDLGEAAADPLVLDVQDSVSEPMLAAARFRRDYPLGTPAGWLAVIGGVAGAIVLAMVWIVRVADSSDGQASASLISVIACLVVGFAVFSAIGRAILMPLQNLVRRLRGSLPNELLLAVTATTVLVFATRASQSDTQAVQVAEWNRAELSGSAEYGHAGDTPSVLTLHPSGSRVWLRIKPLSDPRSPDTYKRAVVLLAASGPNPA